MKNIIIILFFIFSFTTFAVNSKVKKDKNTIVKEWINKQPLEFIENKGQFKRTDGKIADEVLFKTSTGNFDIYIYIYITDKGLSYVYVKYKNNEEDEFLEDNQKKWKNRFKYTEKTKEGRKKVQYYRLDMDLLGANINNSNIIKEDINVQGHYNYFYTHCSEGIYDVKGYGKITIKNIYKGIDWVIYTDSNSKEYPFKYDFIVHPEANYKDIKIKYSNSGSISLIEDNTKIKLKIDDASIEEGKLCCFVNDTNHIVDSKYIINEKSTIMFDIAEYDKNKTLIIDPLVWATYYGGSTSFDGFTSICSDNLDNIYVVGYATSTDFPTMHMNGAFWQSFNISACNDAIILKFNNQGVRQWATFYGGNIMDFAFSVATDNQNNIFVIGETFSSDFPTQSFTGAYNQLVFGGQIDGFILKFNTQGLREWATFYGGTYSDSFSEIVIDNQNKIYLTGFSSSSDFPIQQLAGAYWQTNNGGSSDAVILKFNNQGVREWVSFYGGSDCDVGKSICIDHLNNIYMVGETTSQNFPTQQLAGAYWQANNGGFSDSYIVKFNPQGIRQWASYYGGDDCDVANSICVDSQSNIFITGNTSSQNFPLQIAAGAYNQLILNGSSDMYILKFNNQGVRQWATYYGGSNNENQIKVICKIDMQDNLYITGCTMSTDFPLQQLQNEYWQPNLIGVMDNVIIKFSNQGIRQWATYYGGLGNDFGTGIIVDSHNEIYFIGEWTGINNYTVNYGNGAYYNNSWNGGDDSFIIRISPCIASKPDSIIASSNNICMNDTNQITLTSIGGIGDTLRWYSSGCGINCIGINTPLTISTPTQTITYYARWENQCDTSFCDSVTINVFTHSLVNQNISICQGDSILVGQHYYKNNGNYIDTLLSIYGCDSIVITKLTVNQKPYLNLGKNREICNNDKIKLEVNPDFTSYLWQDSSTNYFLIIDKPGTYWLKANYKGCYNSDTIEINKCSETNIWIPNSFTPNKDGINETFKITTSENVDKYEMIIYNRWGEKIFNSKNINIGWDGKYLGNDVEVGIYNYIVFIKTNKNDKEELFTGHINLLR